jgi:hypothetical protein
MTSMIEPTRFIEVLITHCTVLISLWSHPTSLLLYSTLLYSWTMIAIHALELFSSRYDRQPSEAASIVQYNTDYSTQIQ